MPPAEEPADQATPAPVDEMPAPARENRKRLRGMIILFQLVVVLGYISLAAFPLRSASSAQAREPSVYSVPATASYSALVPGPCKHSAALWAAGGSADRYVCQGRDLLLQQRSSRYFATMRLIFDPSGSDMVPAYRVMAHARIIDHNGTSCVGLSAHNTGPDSGEQIFWACALGVWFVERLAPDGSFDRTLADGVLPRPSPDLALQVDVLGAVMRFTINGTLVGTVIDPTYHATSAIALNLAGTWPVRQTPAAAFSQFRYAPLAVSTQALQGTLVSAQAQQQREMDESYAAAVPGYGCDAHGRAWWSPAAYGNGTFAAFTCHKHAFEMQRFSGAPSLTEETFFWHNGLFPSNYRTSVTLDLRHSHGGCAGLLTRARDAQGYGYLICQNGAWSIMYYAPGDGYPLTLASGMVSPRPTYHLVVTDFGDTHTVMINGRVVATQRNGDFTDTEYLALLLQGAHDGASDALFSDFSFTPWNAPGPSSRRVAGLRAFPLSRALSLRR